MYEVSQIPTYDLSTYMKHIKITLNGNGMFVMCYMEIVRNFNFSSSYPFQYTTTPEITYRTSCSKDNFLFSSIPISIEDT